VYYQNQWIRTNNRVDIHFSYSGSIKRSIAALGTAYFVLTLSANATFSFNSTNIACYLDYSPLQSSVITLGTPAIVGGLTATMEIPTVSITADIPDMYLGIFSCIVPWRSSTETVPVASNAFTVTPALKFGTLTVSAPVYRLDTVASTTTDGWQVDFSAASANWLAKDYGLQGNGGGYLRLGLKRGGSSTETYRGAPGTFCTVSARPANTAGVLDGGSATVSVVPPVAPHEILISGYCQIPISSLHIHGVSGVDANSFYLVLSMYFVSAPSELTSDPTLGFTADGWLSTTYTLN